METPQNKPCQSKISSRYELKVSLVVETMDDKENQRRVAIRRRVPESAAQLVNVMSFPRRATLSDPPRSSTPARLFCASGTCSHSPTVCDRREGWYPGKLVSTLPCALGGSFFSPLASTRPRGSYLFPDPGFRRSHNGQTH